MVGRQRGEERLQTWQHVVLGGLSGAAAASVTMPLDYVKTATQCGSPLGTRELLRLTLREKGPRGFFAGMVRYRSCAAIVGCCFRASVQRLSHFAQNIHQRRLWCRCLE